MVSCLQPKGYVQVANTILGRTGRIGHRGVATSFFDFDCDEAMADVLTRTLLETKQEIPEFLQTYVPEGELALKPRFETESDYDENEVADSGNSNGLGNASAEPGGAWGGGDSGDAAGNSGSGSGWGQDASNSNGAPAASNGGSGPGSGWEKDASNGAPAASNGWGVEATPVVADAW